MTEEKESNIQGLKKELDGRKKVLDDVIAKMKGDKGDISEKELKTLKNIEKNRDVMDRISTLLEKSRKTQEE
jgi:hypothetical protein